jgi:hemin uptake protein HemP
MSDAFESPLRPRTVPAHPPEMREFDSRDLLDGKREVLIRHGREIYRLSVTRSGKLILRK